MATYARADIYAYTDEQGVMHLSDMPRDARYELVIAEPKPQLAAPVSVAPAPVASAPVVNAVPVTGQAVLTVIQSTAAKYRMDAALIRAVIEVESNFNPRALSPKGAQGLMQLMPATALRLGVADAFDPAQNIEGGVRYLAELIALFKNDLLLALAAYNAGEGAVMRHGNAIPPYRETLQYVPKVLEVYQRNRGKLI